MLDNNKIRFSFAHISQSTPCLLTFQTDVLNTYTYMRNRNDKTNKNMTIMLSTILLISTSFEIIVRKKSFGGKMKPFLRKFLPT